MLSMLSLAPSLHGSDDSSSSSSSSGPSSSALRPQAMASTEDDDSVDEEVDTASLRSSLVPHSQSNNATTFDLSALLLSQINAPKRPLTVDEGALKGASKAAELKALQQGLRQTTEEKQKEIDEAVRLQQYAQQELRSAQLNAQKNATPEEIAKQKELEEFSRKAKQKEVDAAIEHRKYTQRALRLAELKGPQTEAEIEEQKELDALELKRETDEALKSGTLLGIKNRAANAIPIGTRIGGLFVDGAEKAIQSGSAQFGGQIGAELGSTLCQVIKQKYFANPEAQQKAAFEELIKEEQKQLTQNTLGLKNLSDSIKNIQDPVLASRLEKKLAAQILSQLDKYGQIQHIKAILAGQQFSQEEESDESDNQSEVMTSNEASVVIATQDKNVVSAATEEKSEKPKSDTSDKQEIPAQVSTKAD